MSRVRFPMPVALALFAALPVPAQEAERPLETGLVEETGVSLILLDVVAVDKRGQPIRGLTAADFEVRLGGKSWPVYSVDDFCTCDDEAGRPSAEPSDAGTSATEEIPEEIGESQRDPPHYILYFDFSQLQLDGRAHAVGLGRQWIREQMRPNDRVQVVAYATLSGLVEMTPFTEDRAALLQAIDRSASPEFLDPFPSELDFRIRECRKCLADCRAFGIPRDPESCCPVCKENMMEEHYHGQHALQALRSYLSRLESLPGRKRLFYFHQNGMLYPHRLYPIELDIPDQLRALEETGAEAVASRTVVYPAYSGTDPNLTTDAANGAVNFGANFADFTGSEYNRRLQDLPRIMTEAGRGCECLYRVAVEPPTTDKTKVYRISVKARNRRISGAPEYVRFLTPIERWRRGATEVLRRPESADDLPLQAMLVPLGFDGSRWTAEVQIVVDVSALTEVPLGDRQSGDWEVGAVLRRDEGRRHWQMLSVSRSERETGRSSEALVVHRRTFERLRPGAYRLSAFVRDRNDSVYGGAEADLLLPKSNRTAIFGPLIMRVDAAWLSAALPLYTTGKETADPVLGDPTVGPRPLMGSALEVGGILEARSWLCRGRQDESGSVQRYVARNGEPLFRLEELEVSASDACVEVRDRIETGDLLPGDYSYHLRWRPGTDDGILDEASVFKLVDGR